MAYYVGGNWLKFVVMPRLYQLEENGFDNTTYNAVSRIPTETKLIRSDFFDPVGSRDSVSLRPSINHGFLARGDSPLYGLYSYVRPQGLSFLSILVINKVAIWAILVPGGKGGGAWVYSVTD